MRLAPHSKRRLRLKLNARGREAVASCAGRDLRVRVGGNARVRDLVRDTAECAPKPVDLTRAGECDFVGQQQGSLCLLPFPDDYYTVADETTRTGRRVELKTPATPPTPPACTSRPARTTSTTGSAPGSRSSLKVPGLDTPAALAATDPVALNHLGRYAEPDAPVVVIDAETGERWPIWVELDSNATERREDRADDQPGGQLRLRAPLRGRPARPARRRRRRSSPPPRASATTATTSHRPSRRSRPSAPASIRSSPPCAAPTSAARTSISRGTSPSPATRTSPGACSRSETTPSPSSATRRWPT